MIQWCVYAPTPRQGISHKMRGNSPCQDMTVFKENDDVIVAVLSDGLGQLEYSQIAATAITESVSTYLINEYNQLRNEDFKGYKLKYAILAECKKAIRQCSDSLNISMLKMDGTLLFVVLFKDASQLIFGQLGDGAICVVKDNQGFRVSTADDKYKVTSNLTKTVLSRDAVAYFNLRKCSALGIAGVFLTSDGLENELYSKAGKVKKKVEWYFNLISNKPPSIWANEIKDRWDELTSDEKYGFTDDMSLIAIVQRNVKIKLPEDANWRCACGNRNRLESTRCESCGKDFLKVYKGINFKQARGSKQAFFAYINENPEEELNIMQKYSEYPLEFHKQRGDEVQRGGLPKDEISLPDLSTQPIDIRNQSLDTNNVQQKQQIKPVHQVQQTAEPVKTYNRHRGRNNIGNKLNILACLLIGFILGILVHTILDRVISDNSKYATMISNFQKENDGLQLEKSILSERIGILNARIAELEDSQSKKVNIPDDYDYYTLSNGDVYIGRLSQGLPNGIGVVYSSGMLLAGRFQEGKKNGEFYVLYDDGNFIMRKYEKDVLVNE